MTRFRDPGKDRELNNVVSFKPTILNIGHFPEIRDRLDDAFTAEDFQDGAMKHAKDRLSHAATRFVRNAKGALTHLVSSKATSPFALNFG